MSDEVVISQEEIRQEDERALLLVEVRLYCVMLFVVLRRVILLRRRTWVCLLCHDRMLMNFFLSVVALDTLTSLFILNSLFSLDLFVSALIPCPLSATSADALGDGLLEPSHTLRKTLAKRTHFLRPTTHDDLFC